MRYNEMIAQSEHHNVVLYEAKTAPLYHATGFWAACEILENEKFEAGDFSIDRDNFPNISTSSEGIDSPGHAPVQFVINQETVVQRHRIKPNDYFTSKHNNQRQRSEREEKIHTERLPISHVLAVQLFDVPPDFSPNWQDEDFLRHIGGKARAYAMIIRLAKMHSIRVEDFRKKRTPKKLTA